MKPRYKNLSILIKMSNIQKELKNSLRNSIMNTPNKYTDKQQSYDKQLLLLPVIKQTVIN